jgi:hypothetical protein
MGSFIFTILYRNNVSHCEREKRIMKNVEPFFFYSYLKTNKSVSLQFYFFIRE